VEELLERIEAGYDASPRSRATTEEVGPLTLFLSRVGWPYYARPRLGLTDPIAPADVVRVRDRQRELGVPEAFEWVHEVTPSLLAAAEAAGLTVHRYPLMALGDRTLLSDVVQGSSAAPEGVTVRVLPPGDPAARDVRRAIHAAFSEEEPTDAAPDDPGARDPDFVDSNPSRFVGAFLDGRAVGGGSSMPTGRVAELAGIGVIPSARRRGIGAALTAALVADAHDRGCDLLYLSADEGAEGVYASVGFRPVATACIAEPPEPQAVPGGAEPV